MSEFASNATIERLSELLERDEPILLGADERALVRAALVGLAAAERRAAHLERLLEAQGAAIETADRAAAEALSGVDEADAVRYDFAAAERARRELLARIESASSAREIVAAALSFAKDVAILTG